MKRIIIIVASLLLLAGCSPDAETPEPSRIKMSQQSSENGVVVTLVVDTKMGREYLLFESHNTPGIAVVEIHH